jgi:arylsulfatase A
LYHFPPDDLHQFGFIIFTSDNGPHKENGGDPEFFNSNGIFRGVKRDLYEGGIRVPFIAYWPGKIKPGITEQIAALWDMYPTFLNLAGIGLPKNIDGYSLLPTFFQRGKQKQHEYFYWEFHENDGRQAVRLHNWKGVKLAVNKSADEHIELYYLKNDPQEQNNIASKFPSVVKRIEAIMKQEHLPNPDWPLLKTEIKQ